MSEEGALQESEDDRGHSEPEITGNECRLDLGSFGVWDACLDWRAISAIEKDFNIGSVLTTPLAVSRFSEWTRITWEMMRSGHKRHAGKDLQVSIDDVGNAISAAGLKRVADQLAEPIYWAYYGTTIEELKKKEEEERAKAEATPPKE